jgi:Raf kinase inhibitor-like YbhB/YbcL family protein
MRTLSLALTCAAMLAIALAAQAPSPTQKPPQPGGQRRAPIAVMTLTSSAWPDGGQIPNKYTQAGEEVSPPLAWSNVPEDTQSFVLMVRDLDAVTNNDAEVLHWMLWNIPGATRSLPEGVPQGAQLPDGTRQISQSGPYYRGPGAPASGPAHHYVFELYAVDGPISPAKRVDVLFPPLNVPAVGQSPAATRDAVLAAMAGRVRGKGVYVGLFRR